MKKAIATTALLLLAVGVTYTYYTNVNVEYDEAVEMMATERSVDCHDNKIYGCSFLNTFHHDPTSQIWDVSDGEVIDMPYLTKTSKACVQVNTRVGLLLLKVLPKPKEEVKYNTGVLLSKKWYGAGCFEFRMKSINRTGYVHFILPLLYHLVSISLVFRIAHSNPCFILNPLLPSHAV